MYIHAYVYIYIYIYAYIYIYTYIDIRKLHSTYYYLRIQLSNVLALVFVSK